MAREEQVAYVIGMLVLWLVWFRLGMIHGMKVMRRRLLGREVKIPFDAEDEASVSNGK